MIMEPQKITGGVYLVLDPCLERNVLFGKLKQALDGGVEALQIWNNWPASFTLTDKHEFINELRKITSEYSIPVVINEEWELLRTTDLDGIHFDGIPDQYQQLKSNIDRDFIAGITCGNYLNIVRWAEENELDYISFCSMFPSASVDSCEIVRPETIRKARKITRLPLFVSGGLTPENIPQLTGLHIDGIAVISGILSSGFPQEAASHYRQALDKL